MLDIRAVSVYNGRNLQKNEVIFLFRRFWRKLIPAYAIFPLITTGLMNILAFYGPKLVQVFTGSANMTDMTTAFDWATPFAPVWVIPYILSFAFWTFQYITVTHEGEKLACRLVAADFVAKVVCLCFFIFLPTTNVRPEVTRSDFVGFLMRLIYTLDTPTNLFPSIHCFVAWLGTRFIYDCKHLKHRTAVSILCTMGSILVFLSTLFTKQHVAYDVLAGVAVAELGYAVARWTRLPILFERLNDRFQKTRLVNVL